MPTWTDAQLASIDRMLNPRSIAVVGATPRMQYGGRFLGAVLKAQDRVNVYPINPRYDEIMGVRSYASVSDLPEAPDLVAIVVPYHQVLSVSRKAGTRGPSRPSSFPPAFPNGIPTTGGTCRPRWGPLPGSRGSASAAPTAWGSPTSRPTSGPRRHPGVPTA